MAIVILISSLIGVNHYVRGEPDDDGNPEAVACWVDVSYIVWVFILPVGLMIMFNICVVIMVVSIAYKVASNHR